MGQIVLVTGMSGAGRTTALKALEDLGFEAVDNLPVTLLGSLVRPGDRLDHDLAIGIDCRTRAFDPPICSADRRRAARRRPRARSSCSTARTRSCAGASTRRGGAIRSPSTVRSPTASPTSAGSWRACASTPICDRYLAAVAGRPAPSDRRLLRHRQERRLTLSVLSFAYRGGLPREADIVFDVRFLANPHYVDELRPGHGATRGARLRGSRSGYRLLLERLEACCCPPAVVPARRSELSDHRLRLHRRAAPLDRGRRGVRRASARAGWTVVLRHRDTPDANPTIDR